MAIIQLKKIPREVHLEVKRIQFQYELGGLRISLEDIYINLIEEALEKRKNNK